MYLPYKKTKTVTEKIQIDIDRAEQIGEMYNETVFIICKLAKSNRACMPVAVLAERVFADGLVAHIHNRSALKYDTVIVKKSCSGYELYDYIPAEQSEGE